MPRAPLGASEAASFAESDYRTLRVAVLDLQKVAPRVRATAYLEAAAAHTRLKHRLDPNGIVGSLIMSALTPLALGPLFDSTGTTEMESDAPPVIQRQADAVADEMLAGLIAASARGGSAVAQALHQIDHRRATAEDALRRYTRNAQSANNAAIRRASYALRGAAVIRWAADSFMAVAGIVPGASVTVGVTYEGAKIGVAYTVAPAEANVIAWKTAEKDTAKLVATTARDELLDRAVDKLTYDGALAERISFAQRKIAFHNEALKAGVKGSLRRNARKLAAWETKLARAEWRSVAVKPLKLLSAVFVAQDLQEAWDELVETWRQAGSGL